VDVVLIVETTLVLALATSKSCLLFWHIAKLPLSTFRRPELSLEGLELLVEPKRVVHATKGGITGGAGGAERP
jgi:hypothetical protein